MVSRSQDAGRGLLILPVLKGFLVRTMAERQSVTALRQVRCKGFLCGVCQRKEPGGVPCSAWGRLHVASAPPALKLSSTAPQMCYSFFLYTEIQLPTPVKSRLRHGTWRTRHRFTKIPGSQSPDCTAELEAINPSSPPPRPWGNECIETQWQSSKDHGRHRWAANIQALVGFSPISLRLGDWLG